MESRKQEIFSSRLDWDLRPNRLSRLLAGSRAEGVTILDLTESNPTRAALSYCPEEILNALNDPVGMVYEPQPAGLLATREAVSEYYASRGVSVEPDRILLTATTSEAYSYLFKLLANPGDEVLVPRPSYPLFEFLGRLESVRLKSYPLIYQDGWWLDLDALRSALSIRSRAILVVNPNNPTGSFAKREEVTELLNLCEDRNLVLIADEVFSDYAFRPDPRRAESLVNVDKGLVFCLSGLSKLVGLPQMKLSWIVASGRPAARHRAMKRLELIADTYLSVSAPIQHAVGRWLSHREAFQRELLARLRGNLCHLEQAVRGSACQLLDVEGGWYVIVRLPRTRTEEGWAELLLVEDGVLVQPGYFYDFHSEAFIVVSLLTPQEVFQEGVARLIRRVSASV